MASSTLITSVPITVTPLPPSMSTTSTHITYAISPLHRSSTANRLSIEKESVGEERNQGTRSPAQRSRMTIDFQFDQNGIVNGGDGNDIEIIMTGVITKHDHHRLASTLLVALCSNEQQH
ncbi:Hypothetical predicted protein [Olea europaea subsp. europaea]|uniref:Uncharacterized protein n=1 Tax=Olea europaea subsp. europaea TaxID=158383 RepID=A0A8S0QXY6_OLEEU|nr:Hypothetical predicted protein [Olea europaea subsp. europaea]